VCVCVCVCVCVLIINYTAECLHVVLNLLPCIVHYCYHYYCYYFVRNNEAVFLGVSLTSRVGIVDSGLKYRSRHAGGASVLLSHRITCQNWMLQTCNFICLQVRS